MNISNVGTNPYRQYVSEYKASKEAAVEESSEDGLVADVKDFTCGLFGIDRPEAESQEAESATEQDDGYYSFGQYIKAGISAASVISILA